MATSERILTTVPNASNVQRVAPRSVDVLYGPAWRRPAIDFVMISLCLIAIPALFGETIAARASYAPSIAQPYLIALMITTIFAFTGVYPRHPTPLDIADTEGLVRGIVCTMILLAIGSFGNRIAPDYCVVTTAVFVIAALIVQREFAHILRRRDSTGLFWPKASLADTPSRVGGSGSVSGYDASFEMSYGRSPASHLVKRAVDIVLATALLALVMPLLLIVAVLIRIDSLGPVLIRQRRIGLNGASFLMWKFRSMHAGVERYAHSPVSDTDPRLTRFGRSLRRLSIDELPQLFNVLTGDMSLVGPRPEMPFIVKKYTPHERLRLHATPGITGLWQISPARAMPIHKNLQLDLFYIEHRNIFLDLAILLRTITAVARGIGAN